MSYLTHPDIYAQIQGTNLEQIIGNDFSILHAALKKAQEQCISYLVQKYDTTAEFTDTNIWNFTDAYNANNRVYLDAKPYDQTKTYALNILTLIPNPSGMGFGTVYICTTPVTVPAAFNLTSWLLLGNQYQLFYALYSYPQFNYLNFYNIGDKVYWKGNVYTASIATQPLDHQTRLQLVYIQDIPYINIFPDDSVNGLTHWGIGVPYSVPSGTLPTNTTYWICGDNRSQQLMETTLDLAIYKLHTRIAPMKTPQLRVNNYHIALDWLQKAAVGDVTPNLPVLQPRQGASIRYGGRVKEVNSF